MSVHGKATSVVLEGLHMSQWCDSIEHGFTIDPAETTGFQMDAKTYIAGLGDATVSLSGRFQGVADEIDDVIQQQIDDEVMPLITVGWGMGLKSGNPCLFGEALHTAFNVTAPVDDIVSLAGELQFSDDVLQGLYLMDLAAQSSTSVTGPTVDLGTQSPRFYGDLFADQRDASIALHVVQNTRSTSSTFRVQHSTDGSSWADLGTFTVVAAGTTPAELIRLGSGCNRYVRATATLTAGTGTVTPLIEIGF